MVEMRQRIKAQKRAQAGRGFIWRQSGVTDDVDSSNSRQTRLIAWAHRSKRALHWPLAHLHDELEDKPQAEKLCGS